jgi:hypothetical protein
MDFISVILNMKGIDNMAKASQTNAKVQKKDEFYTRLTDISKELMHYKKHFKGKVVYCNCDDPTYSAFWKYFHLNFEVLGLKKLISTHYDKTSSTYKMEYEGGDDNNIEIGVITPLEGNGDFRNQECLDLMDVSDVIVTNPPFSLLNEYIQVLFDHKKDFIIWANNNVITYKEIFPLIKDNQMWLGYTVNQTLLFRLPNSYEKYDSKATEKINDGHKYGKVPAISTFTTLDIEKRHTKMPLWKEYSLEEFPFYNNYDAINVDKTSNIPMDYDGIMGVPITFLGEYNPDQFEIIGSSVVKETMPVPVQLGEDFISKYRNQGGTGHFSANMYGLCYYTDEGIAKVPYARILIRRKDDK